MQPTLLKIRLYGDPCLRKKSLPVDEIGPGERMLIQSMITTMHHAKGIGLAAPQVGINQRILVADIGDGPIAVINPKVLKESGQEVLEEGCLSIPEVNIDVTRSARIRLQYIDENNNEVERDFEDLLARVILHETDHLDGKLIVDYADAKKSKEIKSQLEQIEQSRE